MTNTLAYYDMELIEAMKSFSGKAQQTNKKVKKVQPLNDDSTLTVAFPLLFY
jgi:hypothetical protein